MPIRKENELERTIQMVIRRPLYDRFRNVVTSSSKTNVTAHLYSDIFEQVRSQMMNPMQENLIIPNTQNNEYDKYGRGIFKSPI